MRKMKSVAFVGNSLPRRCGIATFTTDIQTAVAALPFGVETCIAAMTDHGQVYDYPASVVVQIHDGVAEDYVAAAAALNARSVDVVSLQHEFGIFGGQDGADILTLMRGLNAPIVTTLHTILEDPTPSQRSVLERVIAASARIVVMAEKGRDLLCALYRTPREKIEVIAHGIPDAPFVGPEDAKERLGFSGRSVILTFGLLSPNKGVEVMIDAMPSILLECPGAVYVVLGATHPNLVRCQGEAYRDGLVQRARSLGVSEHVVFLDRFVDQPTLLDFISACDVYVTPYQHAAQMTSGTLAYSFGLGKAVVSTPYWHACELLAEERGVLVPFGDQQAFGKEIASLLTDDRRRDAMRRRAYASSRAMTWERTAERYAGAFEKARQTHRLRVISHSPGRPSVVAGRDPPPMQLGHFMSMCDDTGLFQHAVHCVPDRAHGYCVDDNARALLLASNMDSLDEKALPESLVARFASFVQHAWNPDAKRFRNFMGFDRRWLEEIGSEDSHGRTLWALGVCAQHDRSATRRRWATALFAEALPPVEGFLSPRAWAFALLGLDAYRMARPDDPVASRLCAVLADRLMALLSATESPGWVWFEDGLAYDNARLPQALLVTGRSTGSPAYADAGLRALRWLLAVQLAPSGVFRPVGSESFGMRRRAPAAFDQQPLEAAATISACLAAYDADGEGAWKAEARRAFAWFLGANDLGVPLVDVETGSCRDGLHPDRANENRGGESVVSYLNSLAEIRQLARISGGLPDRAPSQALLRA